MSGSGMTDEYRELQHARWLAARGGPAPKQPAISQGYPPSSTEPRKRLASVDSDEEIRVLKHEQRAGSFEDDEALARRLQAEFDGVRAQAAAGGVEEDSELARLLQEEEDRRMRSFTNPGKGTTEGDLVEPTPDIHSLFRNFDELVRI